MVKIIPDSSHRQGDYRLTEPVWQIFYPSIYRPRGILRPAALPGGYFVTELICIKCPSAEFLDPKKEICYKTGGLYCKKLKQIVGKYDRCRVGRTKKAKKSG